MQTPNLYQHLTDGYLVRHTQILDGFQYLDDKLVLEYLLRSLDPDELVVRE